MKRNYFTWKKLIIGVPSILLIFAVYLYINFDDIYFNYNPKRATFSKLESIRDEKKTKVKFLKAEIDLELILDMFIRILLIVLFIYMGFRTSRSLNI